MNVFYSLFSFIFFILFFSYQNSNYFKKKERKKVEKRKKKSLGVKGTSRLRFGRDCVFNVC